MVLELVSRLRPALPSPHVARFDMAAFRAGDLAICYVHGQAATGPPDWWAARIGQQDTLFWRVLSGCEVGPRFRSPAPLGERCGGGVVYRGASASDPLELGRGTPILGQ